MKAVISQASYIAAASICQAKQDVRYYLNGILLERGPKPKKKGDLQGLIITATDGHRLFAAYDRDAVVPDNWPDQVIVQFATETLKTAKLTKHRNSPLIFVLEDTQTSATVGDVTCLAQVIGGTSPKWRNIVKDRAGKSNAWFDPKYLADMNAISRLLGNSKDPAISIRSDSDEESAIVRFSGYDDVFALIMPMREGIKYPALPNWSRQKQQKAAA